MFNFENFDTKDVLNDSSDVCAHISRNMAELVKI